MISNSSGLHLRLAPLTYGMPISTLDGEFIARYSNKGLCGLDFPAGAKRRKSETGAARLPAQIRRWHAVASKALRLALAGQSPKELPPLDLSGGTEFQCSVWQTLRKITQGRTWSYSQVAQAIGKPKAVRAVGGACGANPIPVLVPCHRVLAANSGLGGFSGGLNWKRALLKREGIRLPD
ncbi:MAG: methylated-DNA--[protein]-cysteine S-methyltransferase [Candidatus Bipolaricaulota bacterium]|nr:methylated-DNA--[protein]-cysteine S-methyltransferase [Candidatus Bipolaricaulota bacterium]